jgi:hypothetical protein
MMIDPNKQISSTTESALDPFLEPYSQQKITPEILQQLMALGVLDEKGQLLQDQLAMAQALRGGVGKKQYQTGIGGAFGAAADILNTINAQRQTDEARRQQEELLKQKAAGREQFAKLWGY